MTTYVLGLNAYHADSAACLYADGVLVAAAEEERFRRIKHWSGFPSAAIGYCLNEAGIGVDRLDHIAVNQNIRTNWRKMLAYMLKRRPDLAMIIERAGNVRARASISDELAVAFGARPERARIHKVEHHHAHLASAANCSPFDDCAVVSVDGFGDFASTAWGGYEHGRLAIDGRIFFPHSLGIFYQVITQFLGFPNYGDEYKVMGLSSWGKPTRIEAMRRILSVEKGIGFALNLDCFRHPTEKLEYEWADGEPKVGRLFTDALCDILGSPRAAGEAMTETHHNIAASAQRAYEEVLFAMLNAIAERRPGTRLAIAGGCGMNSVANGRVCRNTPFQRLYVQPAAGDSGGAIGAALVAHAKASKSAVAAPMTHAYWGPGYGDDAIARVIAADDRLRTDDIEILHLVDEAALCACVARRIADGGVIGWFQGRMEWGPRALGNRSILADPRRTDMRDLLNIKIKRRESFRPFAPSVLREAVGDWFEDDDDVPFMTHVFPIRAERRTRIPAVTHVDGSGRLQTVTAAGNPRYYRLISAFRDLTGIPMLLNTSFNENEPIVCRPEEALDCFLRTRMDMLALGSYVISRKLPAA